ncbi:MAG: adenylate/guanylate cyclase domain-containing protein [Alphaproteobacteria bacterium]|jgi:adenylate cyclase|nr:adenylate/guanylate cyclase domain-containing protein [Alphaproteobacteria bacterium]MDP6566761.1 adenylate/guanylate cyclase domain-containing protein [Alphaproteobacteria bacterium]MDP6812971.1 adenylate/guanylate cyclase domain-containing protein [Alphaproteobacteria bacterium]
MADIERKLTTIMVADAVGFSTMMEADETSTLAVLKSCRGIIDDSIDEHRGRIFGGAGDSVVADFSSPVQAVLCASEFQQLLSERNAHHPDGERMRFRVGINLGDVIIDGDNLYGDGVNVAARLESISRPGGVCVSSKVYEEVRRKLDLLFIDGGTQQLKNLADPVAIYHVRAEDGEEATATSQPAAAASAGRRDLPAIAVPELKVISGDDEVRSLADGLREDIIGGLAKQTAIEVLAGEAAADFRLEGSVRAAGQRLRLSFTLIEEANGRQAWTERYDRQLDDVFDLEDEISENVVSTVRIQVKAKAFEELRNTDNDTLSVPDLLSKAAGYFVHSPGHNDEAAEILTKALEQQPDNSMAVAMMAFCRYRHYEFDAAALPQVTLEELVEYAKRANSLSSSSFFARLTAAMVYQDLQGDFPNALKQAEASLELNPKFTQAQAMAGIAKCHLGDGEAGLEMLERAIAATPEDPHRFRHRRELALIHFINGQDELAAETADQLVRQAADLWRNHLTLAALSWQAGRQDLARETVSGLLRQQPELTLETMRPQFFADDGMAHRYRQALADAGLPE